MVLHKSKEKKMEGTLFEFHNTGTLRLVAFQSGSSRLSSNECFVVLGGLTDGLLSVPYVQKLSESACTIQPQFSSSNTGFGITSIDNDVQELCILLSHPRLLCFNSIILVGHSTGCQILMRFLRDKLSNDDTCGVYSKIHRLILQAPVSDRQGFLDGSDEMSSILSWATTEPCPQNDIIYSNGLFCGAPINAARVRSLLTRMGDEDFFSTDLSVDEICSQIHNASGNTTGRNINIECVLSGSEEYIPSDSFETYHQFFKHEFKEAMRREYPLFEVGVHVVEGADHSCSTNIDGICAFILQANLMTATQEV